MYSLSLSMYILSLSLYLSLSVCLSVFLAPAFTPSVRTRIVGLPSLALFCSDLFCVVVFCVLLFGPRCFSPPPLFALRFQWIALERSRMHQQVPHKPRQCDPKSGGRGQRKVTSRSLPRLPAHLLAARLSRRQQQDLHHRHGLTRLSGSSVRVPCVLNVCMCMGVCKHVVLVYSCIRVCFLLYTLVKGEGEETTVLCPLTCTLFPYTPCILLPLLHSISSHTTICLHPLTCRLLLILFFFFFFFVLVYVLSLLFVVATTTPQ
jgi:hypothetical protein